MTIYAVKTDCRVNLTYNVIAEKVQLQQKCFEFYSFHVVLLYYLVTGTNHILSSGLAKNP